MNNLLKDFELIVILKTEIFRVDLNFLSKNDLLVIEECALGLGLDEYLTYFDLESIYDFEYDEVKKIYKQWCDDIIKVFNEYAEKLNGQLR